jgi:hypothetical protein
MSVEAHRPASARYGACIPYCVIAQPMMVGAAMETVRPPPTAIPKPVPRRTVGKSSAM